MIETSVLDTIAASVERELARVSAARPGLASRVERAGDIVVTHLSCRRQRVIRVRVRDGRARFLVSGSGGAVYVVDPASWSCSCPDYHRRGAGCKHALGCYVLARVSRPAPKLPACVSCGGCFPHGELAEVQESLTYNEDDLLCHRCWLSSDAEAL